MFEATGIDDFFDSLEFFGIKLGLEQTEYLFELLGNPQKRLKFVHVAGTNGKGSVCAMIESALRHTGFHTGFYSSPHLVSMCERIRIDGQVIPHDLMESHFPMLLNAVRRMEKEKMHVTYFEAMTALAALIFFEANVDIVVWETGMGGRLDSTNIVTPLVSVITGISLEHTAYLGDTLEKIASEKAGIIKRNIPVVVSPRISGGALSVIRNKAESLQAPFVIPSEPLRPESIRFIHNGRQIVQSFCLPESGNMRIAIPLAGSHQRCNAAVAIAALSVLARQLNFPITSAIDGLSLVSWPCRFEFFPEYGLIVDSAHNPEGLTVLADTLAEVFPHKKFRFFFGAFSDKNAADGIRAIAPLASEFVFLSPNSERSHWSAEELNLMLAEIAPGLSSVQKDLSSVVPMLDKNIPSVLCGSLHLCGDLIALFKQ